MPDEPASRDIATDSGTQAAAQDLAIEVRNLSHSFKKQRALHNVSFDVNKRSIHGFVGPNGAGKTTTLKVIATLLKPHTGRVRVVGHDVRRGWKDVRKNIGYMPDHFSMYRQMTVFEYLDFFAAAYGLNYARRNQIIDNVLTLTDMDGRRDDLIKGLSRGMMQRVSLARVLVNDPQLLLLDEPASGLDPRARIELMEILRELRNMGKTIFISSHILSELADLCDSVTIIDHGEVKYSGGMSDLLKHEGETIAFVLELASEVVAMESLIRSLPGVQSISQENGAPEGGAPKDGARYLIQAERGAVDSSILLRAALDNGADVVSFQEDRRHLNQVFMDLTEPGVR